MKLLPLFGIGAAFADPWDKTTNQKEYSIDDGAGGTTAGCLICEYVNIAANEAAAVAALTESTAADTVPCILPESVSLNNC